MPWLKTRLRALDKTPAGLARHLKVHAPRIYEMIAGRRGILPTEITPIAKFLDWPVEELLKHMPRDRRVLPTDSPKPPPKVERDSSSSYEIKNREAQLSLRIPQCAIPIVSTMPVSAAEYDATLNGDVTARFIVPSLEGRTDVCCMYLRTDRMTPWKQAGEMVMFEKERPPREHDHVVLYLTADDRLRVLIRQLLPSKRENKICLREHNPRRDFEIDRKNVDKIYRVLTWEDIFR